MYGTQKLSYGVEGIELLREGDNVATERMLTDVDIKRIRLLKLRKVVRKVDRKGFRSSDEEESGDFEKDSNNAEMGEDDMDDEMGEDDMDGEESEDKVDDKEGLFMSIS